MEELGMRIAASVISDDLKLIFRDKRSRDIGIDAEIEYVIDNTNDRKGSGRLIALQIKCGMSFFTETTNDAYVFRGEKKHLDYWLGHSLPVLIVLCHPTERVAYWVEVTPGVVHLTKDGWKTHVPKANNLALAKWKIESIINRNRVDDIIDLCLQAWVHSRYNEAVQFAGIMAMPRDYHWYRHLITIGHETRMLHWIYARYGKFELSELQNDLSYLQGNLTYASTLILCLVAESESSFRFNAEWVEFCSSQKNVEIVWLIFDRTELSIYELTADGKLISEYHKGKPLVYY